MKIVILSEGFPPETFGGAEVIASNLASALLKKCLEVSVITTTKDKNKVGVSIENGLKIYSIYSDYNTRYKAYRSLKNAGVVNEVSRIVREIKPDIVHAHNIHNHISYASLKEVKKYCIAVCMTMHDVMSVHYGKLGAKVDTEGNVVMDSINPWKQFLQYKLRYNPLRNVFIRHYLKSVDKIFAVSLALKEVLEKQGILGIEVLHNGIDVSLWKVNHRALVDFKQKYNPENKKVLFFSGRLSSAKGGFVAVSVLKQVSLKMKEVLLIVAGDKNKWTEDMEKIAGGSGISDKIIFTGRLSHDDIRYAYSASDVVLTLSLYVDPFPTVNLEAMACKKPVVGTIFGGTREVVVSGKTGYLVNPRDIELTSRKTLELLEDRQKAESFGLAGFNRVSSDFSQEKWAEETLSYYATMLLNRGVNKHINKK